MLIQLLMEVQSRILPVQSKGFIIMPMYLYMHQNKDKK